MKAHSLLTRVSEIVGDHEFVNFKLPQAIAWLNDAQRAIAIHKPDAFSRTETVKLEVGSKQTIPAGCLAIFGNQLNMGADGLTPGREVLEIDGVLLSRFSPAWRSATGSVVKEWFPDPSDPNTYYVVPSVVGDVYLQVSGNYTPTTVMSPASELSIKEIFAPAIVNWLAYRFFSRDSELTPNYARAAGFEASFYQLLGVKMPYKPKPPGNE